MVTITERSVWCMALPHKFVGTSRSAEEFIHKDLAVFTCHEFFICFILIKHTERTFIEGASSANPAIDSFRLNVLAVLASTLLFFI